MSHTVSLTGRSHRPEAPSAVADAVELYAREHGRTATIECIPTAIFRGRAAALVWRIRFSLRVNDKRWLLFQDGRAEKPPTEDVWLHEPNPKAGQMVPGSFGRREPDFIPLDLEQLGPVGIREFLERGNTWSGRGEFSSVEDAHKKTLAHNDEMGRKIRRDARDDTRHDMRDRRRSWLGIPFLSVLKDIGSRKQAADTGGQSQASTEHRAGIGAGMVRDNERVS